MKSKKMSIDILNNRCNVNKSICVEPTIERILPSFLLVRSVDAWSPSSSFNQEINVYLYERRPARTTDGHFEGEGVGQPSDVTGHSSCIGHSIFIARMSKRAESIDVNTSAND